MSRLELRLSNWASTTGGSAELAFGPARRWRSAPSSRSMSATRPSRARSSRAGQRARGRFPLPACRPRSPCWPRTRCSRRGMARRSRIYADTVAGRRGRARSPRDLGLTPVVAGLDAPVGTWAQLNESDLGLPAPAARPLRRRRADRRRRAARLAARRRAAAARSNCSSTASSAACASAPTSPTRSPPSACAAGMPRDGAAVEGRATAAARTSARAPAATAPRCCDDALRRQRSEHLAHMPVAQRRRGARRRRGRVRPARAPLRARRRARPRATRGCASAAQVAADRARRRASTTPTTWSARAICSTCKQGYRTEFGAECAFLGPALMNRDSVFDRPARAAARRPPGARRLDRRPASGCNRVQVRLLAFDARRRPGRAAVGARGRAVRRQRPRRLLHARRRRRGAGGLRRRRPALSAGARRAVERQLARRRPTSAPTATATSASSRRTASRSRSTTSAARRR